MKSIHIMQSIHIMIKANAKHTHHAKHACHAYPISRTVPGISKCETGLCIYCYVRRGDYVISSAPYAAMAARLSSLMLAGLRIKVPTELDHIGSSWETKLHSESASCYDCMLVRLITNSVLKWPKLNVLSKQHTECVCECY